MKICLKSTACTRMQPHTVVICFIIKEFEGCFMQIGYVVTKLEPACQGPGTLQGHRDWNSGLCDCADDGYICKYGLNDKIVGLYVNIAVFCSISQLLYIG